MLINYLAKVMAMVRRSIYQKGVRFILTDKVTFTGIVKSGHAWNGGAYFVEVIQGTERKMIKLLKIN